MSIQGTPPGGPYVSVAVFCDAVLRELDGTESLIRLRRRVSVPVSPTGPVNPVLLTLLIALQSGEAKGRQTVVIAVVEPSGLRKLWQSFNVLFEGEERGSDILLAPFVLQSPQEGLYWFIISIDDHELTRVPLRVIYQPVPPQATPQQLG